MATEPLQDLSDDLEAEKSRLLGIEMAVGSARRFCEDMTGRGASVDAKRQGPWGFSVHVSHPGTGAEGDFAPAKHDALQPAPPAPTEKHVSSVPFSKTLTATHQGLSEGYGTEDIAVANGLTVEEVRHAAQYLRDKETLPKAEPSAEQSADAGKTTRGVPWTPEEDEAAMRVLRRGGSSRDVAKATGRSERAASQRASQLRKRIDAERPADAPKPAPRGAAVAQVKRDAEVPPAPPPEPSPAPVDVPDAPRTGPWEDHEIEVAAKMVMEGKSATDVAKRLNRTHKSAEKRVQDLRQEMGLVKRGQGATVHANTGRSVAPPSAEEGDHPRNYEAAPPLGSSLTPTTAEGDAFWTPERDLLLVQTLSSGGSLAGAARKIGCNLDAAKARWRQHFPDPPTWDAQVKVLAALKAKVAA